MLLVKKISGDEVVNAEDNKR